MLIKNNNTNNNNPKSKPYTTPCTRQIVNVAKTTGTLPMMIAIILKMNDISESFAMAERNKGIKYNIKNKNIKGINSFYQQK
ncbi:hypothetical protein [Akkermansia sp. KLE1797]|uniref:hypothetical protein n=1 Tax=Akkermansia sp. KLE1797 TaxID=1574264 RepID=UPI001E5B24C5|nr:hypothetical protein [Akkermansia sp. KLE1797]